MHLKNVNVFRFCAKYFSKPMLGHSSKHSSYFWMLKRCADWQKLFSHSFRLDKNFFDCFHKNSAPAPLPRSTLLMVFVGNLETCGNFWSETAKWWKWLFIQLYNKNEIYLDFKSILTNKINSCRLCTICKIFLSSSLQRFISR